MSSSFTASSATMSSYYHQKYFNSANASYRLSNGTNGVAFINSDFIKYNQIQQQSYLDNNKYERSTHTNRSSSPYHHHQLHHKPIVNSKYELNNNLNKPIIREDVQPQQHLKYRSLSHNRYSFNRISATTTTTTTTTSTDDEPYFNNEKQRNINDDRLYNQLMQSLDDITKYLEKSTTHHHNRSVSNHIQNRRRCPRRTFIKRNFNYKMSSSPIDQNSRSSSTSSTDISSSTQTMTPIKATCHDNSTTISTSSLLTTSTESINSNSDFVIQYRNNEQKTYLKQNENKKKFQINSNSLTDMLKINEVQKLKPFQQTGLMQHQQQSTTSPQSQLTVENLFRGLKLNCDDSIKKLDEIERVNKLFIKSQLFLLKQINSNELAAQYNKSTSTSSACRKHRHQNKRQCQRQRQRRFFPSHRQRIKLQKSHKFKLNKKTKNLIKKNKRIRITRKPELIEIEICFVFKYRSWLRVLIDHTDLVKLFRVLNLKLTLNSIRRLRQRPKRQNRVDKQQRHKSLFDEYKIRQAITRQNEMQYDAYFLNKRRSRTEEIPKRQTITYRDGFERKKLEIQLIEACYWLMNAGCSHFVHMYENNEFPINIDTIIDYFENNLKQRDLQAIQRRLDVLNKSAEQKIDYKKVKDNYENQDNDDNSDTDLSISTSVQQQQPKQQQQEKDEMSRRMKTNENEVQLKAFVYENDFKRPITVANTSSGAFRRLTKNRLIKFDQLQISEQPAPVQRAPQPQAVETNETLPSKANIVISLKKPIANDLRLNDFVYDDYDYFDSVNMNPSVSVADNIGGIRKSSSGTSSKSKFVPSTATSSPILKMKPINYKVLNELVEQTRRDSGIGQSITSTKNLDLENLNLNCMSAKQVSILKKFAHLRITSLMERYSQVCQKSGWDRFRAVPNFIRKHQKWQTENSLKSKRVFGVPIKANMERVGHALPSQICQIINYIRDNSQQTIGIFRKSGSRSRMNQIREHIETASHLIFNDPNEIIDLADLVKQYFRELPECLLTNKLSNTLIDVFTYVPEASRLEALQHCMLLLDDENREVLQYLLNFLNHISLQSEVTKMDARNIAICFAPTLLAIESMSATPMATNHSPPGSPNQLLSRQCNASLDCLTLMIQQPKKLFEIDKQAYLESNFKLFDYALAPTIPYLLKINDANTIHAFIDDRMEELLKDVKEKSRNWTHALTDQSVEISSKKTDDNCPLRTWRLSIDIEGFTAEDIFHKIYYERSDWDDELMTAKTIEIIDHRIEIVQYETKLMPSQMLRGFCELRAWKSIIQPQTAKSIYTIFSSSVQHNDALKVGEITAVTLKNCYIIEQSDSQKCKLTQLYRADYKSYSPEWYNKFQGHILKKYLLHIRQSLEKSR